MQMAAVLQRSSPSPDTPWGCPMIEPNSFAVRLRRQRERTGKTRKVLGGLVGRSEEWVKALESGRLHMPRLPMLLRLADALGINDLSDLTGKHSIPVESVTKASHQAAGDVAAAMGATRAVDAELTLPSIKTRVDQLWQVWHHSGTERTAVAALLPGLIVDARAATRAFGGVERRQALAQLARVYHLAQLYFAHQPASEYVWLAADRALNAAQDADDPLAIGTAVWYYGHVYRGSGRTDQAEQAALDTLTLIDPEAGPAARTRWGMLHLAIALGAAKAGRGGDAERHLDMSKAAAATLGSTYLHPWLMYGTATVEAYTVTVEADLFRSGEAVRRINHFDPLLIPSQTRRASYLIEAARAYSLRNENVAVLHLLTKAARTSIDTARHAPFLRATTLELAESVGPIREEARELALAVGLLA